MIIPRKQRSCLALIIALTLSARTCLAFTIDFPPDRAIVRSEMIYIVISRGDDKSDSIRVISNGRKPAEISARPGSPAICFKVALEFGLNTIDLLGLQNKEIVTQRRLQIFLESELRQEVQYPPVKFSSYTFHSKPNEAHCTGCHNMEPMPADLTPGKPADSPCYTCHAEKKANVFIHYPNRKWLCLICHRVGTDEQRYTTTPTDRDSCYLCHSDLLNKWQKKHSEHGPTATGKCSLCHDPHSSGNPALLKMQTTDLCIKCHADKESGAHVIAGFFGKGHPVRGVSDPLQPDREFTCAGCHDPHAGDTPNLLRHQKENNMEYCTLCHKM